LIEQEWTDAFVARDWDRVLAMCSTDIVYMPADQPVLRGHAAMREWLDQFPRIISFTQPVDDVDGRHDLAVARVTFAVEVEVAGQRLANSGKAVGWLDRDATGRWVLKSVCWNWDRPLAPAS
jgi:ketosteroid isomerase-like protein